jgi:ABC-type transport system involved in multi-copper enzyme maturation permease subunit
MKTFSVSAHGGHLDLLASWPLSRMEIACGLFLSAFATLALLALLGLAPYVLLLAMGVGSIKLLASSAIGLAFLIAAFAALGLAVCSFARKPMAAALSTLGLLGFMWAMGWAAPYLPSPAAALIQGLAFGPRLDHFTRGYWT